MNLRESTLQRIVQLMKDPQHGIAIKDRTFHFHVFPDCFVGNEFVTWTLHNSIVDTREHATMLGQDLLDRGIIFHASNDQPFKDGYFFYTFQQFPDISDAELDILVVKMKAYPTGVSIQDRSHHLRNYRDCFVGKEAVDWLVKYVPKYATNRQVAVKLGQELMNKGVVHSVNQQAFSDTVDFYFFQKPVYAGYLGKLTKTGTDWKIRWFAIKDIREKKLWYYNSPRDPVPRDSIPLVDACVRVVLDQDVAYMEICTPLRIFTLRPTSSTLLARWVHVLSDFIGSEGCENNLRMELAERSISVHESRVSTKAMRERRLIAVPPSLGEVVGTGLLEDQHQQYEQKQEQKHEQQKLGQQLDQQLEQQYQHLDQQLLLPQQPPPEVLTPRQQNSTHSTPSSSLTDLQKSEQDNDNPLDTTNAPENLETLDLMNDDDLDIDIDDDLFLPSEIGKSSDDVETKYDGGLVGEANVVATGEEGKEVQEYHDDMTEEQRMALIRIRGQLLLTESQDNDYIPSMLSHSLLPPMHSDDTYVVTQTPPRDMDTFHIV